MNLANGGAGAVRGGRRLLFISPVMPAEAGNGLAMRAGVFLEALAADHEVSLLIVPIAGPADPAVIPQFVARHAARVAVLPTEGRADTHYRLISRLRDPAERAVALAAYPRPLMCRVATREAVADAAARFAGVRFDAIHVFRLYMAPFAAPFLGGQAGDAGPASVLDLDDDEPRTRRRLAELYRRRGRVDAAAVEASEADKYERMERDWLPRFGCAAVCSEEDRARIIERLGPLPVRVVPNAVREPEQCATLSREGEFGILLVGSFGYAPNEDAALAFGEEIWPRVVAAASRPARAWIVGSRPSPAVRRLADGPGITVTGEVPHVGPYYARAHVAINPIRAGGGTRIKAIEAFAHGVPLVSTAMGAEGLGAADGRHLVIAESPEQFAQACLRLMREPALAARLAAQARALYRARYAVPRVVADIRALGRAAHVDHAARIEYKRSDTGG